MEENPETSVDRRCRLCAEEQDATIMIFSAEAQAMLLKKKLHNYLSIVVEEHDKLPKNICVQCCSKLHAVCDFIDKSREAQKMLENIFLPIIKNESENEECIDDDDGNTKMEVSVDPMMVLQNSDEPMSPDSSEITTEDVTHMHSVDQENVTIKLIRKNDKSEGNELGFKPFPCVTCNRSFFTELALMNHSWVHCTNKIEKKFHCKSCDESFDFKGEYINHMKRHRISGLCQLCGRCFKSEKNLKAHMVAHQSIGKSYICKICGRSYDTNSNLKTHSITHSNERPYHCHFCKKTFKRNQDLKFHINQHTGAKPYKCPFCDKSFASSGNCYSHRTRMHLGTRYEPKTRRRGAGLRENQPILPLRPIAPKPPIVSVKGMFKYQCTMCEHSFIKRDNFIYHMYQHTGEKPFHCTFCEEKFVTRRGLLLHHGKEHPNKDRPLALLSKNVLLK